MLCWRRASLWLSSSLCFCEWTWWRSFVAVGVEQLDSDSGSRLMPVGSPLDTHDCDWCMLRCHARGINTTRITAAFTFHDLLHHLPNLPWITVTNIAFCVPRIRLFPTRILISQEKSKRNVFFLFCLYGVHPPEIRLWNSSLGWWIITPATVSFCYLINVKSKQGPSSGEGHVAWVLHHNRVDHRPSGRPRQQCCLQQTARASHL